MADTNTSSSTNTSSRQVSEVAFDFLIAEIVHWIQHSPSTTTATSNANSSSSSSKTTSMTPDQNIIRLEQNAAKMERMGYDIGYRFTERLALTRSPFFPLPTGPPPPPTTSTGTESSTITTHTSSSMNMYQYQLEAVKFICKDFWMAIFHKQMDRLQTNHRGTFVLKDLDFVWLKRFKQNTTTASDVTAGGSSSIELLDESNRMIAMQLLALICGMIRGALATFSIGGDDYDDNNNSNISSEMEDDSSSDDPLQQTSSTVVVTCDFFADGKKVESCNFQIKIIAKETSE